MIVQHRALEAARAVTCILQTAFSAQRRPFPPPLRNEMLGGDAERLVSGAVGCDYRGAASGGTDSMAFFKG